MPEQLLLLDQIRRNRQYVTASDKYGARHFAVEAFRKSNRASVQGNRECIAVDGDIANTVDLALVETNLRQLRDNRFRLRGRCQQQTDSQRKHEGILPEALGKP